MLSSHVLALRMYPVKESVCVYSGMGCGLLGVVYRVRQWRIMVVNDVVESLHVRASLLRGGYWRALRGYILPRTVSHWTRSA